ncbi:MAG TPA: CPBP family intramembrane metalloprotease [Cyclobacteriaceae bacterium]|nr:CPBP family intramembrane metalloprotease [Cyclobacteriaceae bacterium]
MSSIDFLYWTLPALPGLILLVLSWPLEFYLTKKRFSPWQVGNISRLLGILIFVLFPFFISNNTKVDLIQLWQDQLSITWKDVLITLPFMALLLYLQEKKRNQIKGMEAFSAADFNLFHLTLHALVWISYLFCYEFYFRAYLLFMAFPESGVVIIVLFNIILYAFVHLSKNMQQVWLSLPFGVLLCAVCLYTGNFWFAFVIHICLALGVELPLLSKKQTIQKSIV